MDKKPDTRLPMRVLAVLLAIALFAASCGGGGDDGDNGDDANGEEVVDQTLDCAGEPDLTIPVPGGGIYTSTACVDENNELACLAAFHSESLLVEDEDYAKLQEATSQVITFNSDTEGTVPDDEGAPNPPPIVDVEVTAIETREDIGLGLSLVSIDLDKTGDYDTGQISAELGTPDDPVAPVAPSPISGAGTLIVHSGRAAEIAENYGGSTTGTVDFVDGFLYELERVGLLRTPAVAAGEFLLALFESGATAPLAGVAAVPDAFSGGDTVLVFAGLDDPEFDIANLAELVESVGAASLDTSFGDTGFDAYEAMFGPFEIDDASDPTDLPVQFVLIELEVDIEDVIPPPGPRWPSLADLIVEVGVGSPNLIGYYHPIIRGHPQNEPTATDEAADTVEADDGETGAPAGNGSIVVVIDSHRPAADWPNPQGYEIREPTPANISAADAAGLVNGHGPFVADLISHLSPGAQVILQGLDRGGSLTAQNAEDPPVDVVLFEESDLIVEIAQLPTIDGIKEAQTVVLNLSLGLYGCPMLGADGLAAALTAVRAEIPNLVVVASSGNDELSVPVYPAAFAVKENLGSWVVSVGSNDGVVGGQATPQSCFSNYGDWVQVWADGEGAVGSYAFGAESVAERASWSGTSFAAPRVSAAIAAGQLSADDLKDVGGYDISIDPPPFPDDGTSGPGDTRCSES